MGPFWTPCLQLTMARIHLLTGAAHSWGCSWTWALLLQKGPKFVTARFSYWTISTWTTIVLLKKYHWYLKEIQISNVNTVATLTIFILSQFHVYIMIISILTTFFYPLSHPLNPLFPTNPSPALLLCVYVTHLIYLGCLHKHGCVCHLPKQGQLPSGCTAEDCDSSC